MKTNSENKRVIIADTTLRDGEQAPGCHLNPDQKLEIAQQLHRMRVDVIEAGFPRSSPAEFNAVRRIAQIVGRASGAPVIGAFGRCVPLDIEECWAAVKEARRPRIHLFIASSDLHLEHKLRKSRAEALDQAVQSVRMAKKFTSDVQFTPEDSTRADRMYLAQMVEAVIEAGAATVNIADTVGYTNPEEFQSLLKFLFVQVKNIHRTVVSVHCHDDLGMAVANSLMAVRAGAGQIEGTINGIGERAGNCALEEVVMALRTRADFFRCDTNVRTEEIYRTSRLVSDQTGMFVQPNKAVVGANAFAHASGIHQDGMLKNRATYEIMRAEDIGAPGTTLPLTNRSGRRAVEHRVREMGIQLSGERFEQFFEKFKNFADKTPFVKEEDLRYLLQNQGA